MEVKLLVCPICGCKEMGKAKINGNVGVCPACDSSFLISVAEKLSKVEIDKTQDIKIFRDKLSSAVRLNDVVSILNYTKKILDIIPEDYLSKYYFAYAHNCLDNGQYLRFFYQDEIAEHTEEEMLQIINHICNYSDLRDDKAIVAYLERIEGIDNQSIIAKYRDNFEQRCRQEEYYDNIPRDVFICHRSVDSNKATKICEALEEDGNTCWISTRNLRPNDIQNYWDNIEKAIENSSIFLVVCSRDAMLSRDVKREMEIAKRLNKPILECKIDDSEHTTFFKVFFDGISWIDMQSEFVDKLSLLKTRVYKLINKKEETPLCEFEINNSTIVRYLGNRNIVVIPSGITTIDSNAFSNNKTIEKVFLSDELLFLGDSVFDECVNLKFVDFGFSLQIIGNHAFRKCRSLTKIQLPASVKEIGIDAFGYCELLENVVFDGIPQNIIGCPFNETKFFKDKKNWYHKGLYVGKCLVGSELLKPILEFNIKEGTSCIGSVFGKNVFGITIPESVLYISDYTFEKCKLDKIYISKNVRIIGKAALNGFSEISVDEGNSYYSSLNGVLFNKNCSKLVCYPANSPKKHYRIPEMVEEVVERSFSSCAMLKWIYASSNLKRIGFAAFANCISLLTFEYESIRKDNQLSIERAAFYDCNNLLGFRIRKTINYIDAFAFGGCVKLHLTSPYEEKETMRIVSKWHSKWNYCTLQGSEQYPIDCNFLDEEEDL